jgi:hypothetical protein
LLKPLTRIRHLVDYEDDKKKEKAREKIQTWSVSYRIFQTSVDEAEAFAIGGHTGWQTVLFSEIVFEYSRTVFRSTPADTSMRAPKWRRKRRLAPACALPYIFTLSSCSSRIMVWLMRLYEVAYE